MVYIFTVNAAFIFSIRISGLLHKPSHMAHIAHKLTDLIGNTPLLELGNFNQHHQTKAIIIAKLEYFNPAEASRTVSVFQ